jgi:protein SCO1/2
MKLKRLLPIIIPLVVFIIGISIAFVMIKNNRTLKIYNPAELNPELVDESLQNVTKLHRVGKFSLIDQHGKTLTEKDFEGKIYVTDFFFTTCPTICPKMTKQMKRVANYYKDNPTIMFLSHSVTPEIDTDSVLNEFAKKYDINYEQWRLATGDKKHIYELARKNYFAVTTKGDGGKEDFIHTENFVLVDKEKRLRGFYDGTSEEDVNRLIDDIEILLNEYEK